ncbi:hypothetical protein MBAV_003597 [Candidatus Magnetobacterium bavaricum]|uniref:Uncharacterized protein n=1 Tax=Candidatus Magnetobacterium bavaricum TaxID=29290 RepID=A0A0F3GQV8_9BACT|nr:hypothetical protein MBAV_003597 [Candidatus Magnetobacterium bavaricum]
MGRELFALTFNIVAGMSPAHNVGNVLRSLVASSFFQYEYAPMAFIALCRPEPEKFPEHLALLRGSFAKLHADIGTDDAYLTARRFVQYVDTSIIADNFYRCSFSNNIDDIKPDNWLVKALLVGEKAPFKLQAQNDDFKIVRSDREQEGPFFEIKYGKDKFQRNSLYPLLMTVYFDKSIKVINKRRTYSSSYTNKSNSSPP